MSFGKRNSGGPLPGSVKRRMAGPPMSGESPSNAEMQAQSKLPPSVPMTSADFVERIGKLKDHLERINQQAVRLAACIKSGARIDTPGFSGAYDADSYPIGLTGFSRHFNFVLKGAIHHGVLAFRGEGDALDNRAQLHLFELATTIMRFNGLFWAAYTDGALSMAVQSETARIDIDRIIALSAIMGGLVDNLLAGEVTRRASGTAVGVQAARQNLAVWVKRAREAMIEPARWDMLVPGFAWPISVVEVGIADHAGQLVVNHVYLPAVLAKPVMETMARETAKAV